MDPSVSGEFTLKQLGKMKCKELKEILVANNKPTSGNKSVLVARCYDLQSKSQTLATQEPDASLSAQSPFEGLGDKKEIKYGDLLQTASGRQWSNDLRQFPPLNFHQLFEYLVEKNQKYGEKDMKGLCFKKMKSYQFYEEGNISKYNIAKAYGYTWVKAEVIASMRHTRYRIIAVFSDVADIKYAACECPAGLNRGGLGKCNHIGGLRFAIQDFHSKGLQNQPEKVSCTSKLSGWVVPRNLTVKPKPLKEIKIKKHQFGREKQHIQVNQFDPRSPADRTLDHHSFIQLYKDLEECAPNSAFFLYHTPLSHNETNNADCNDIDISFVAEDVSVIASTNENDYVPKQVPVDTCTPETAKTVTDIQTFLTPNVDQSIGDEIEINDHFIKEHVEPQLSKQVISDEQIEDIECATRGQSENKFWCELHKFKITASNFGKVMKCSKSPDGILKSMLYAQPKSKYLTYGKENEHIAIEAYSTYKKEQGNEVTVKEVGLMISKDHPGYGASLDGLVFDVQKAEQGGLECKCPLSKAGQSIDEAVADPKFYLNKEAGVIKLHQKHNYFIQVQGQMFVTGLKWVDFVVYFGSNRSIFVERIFFDAKLWSDDIFPKLDRFYKWAFIPELLTRRVQRGNCLISESLWKKNLSRSVKGIKP